MIPSGATEWAIYAAILGLHFLAPFSVPLVFWLSDAATSPRDGQMELLA